MSQILWDTSFFDQLPVESGPNHSRQVAKAMGSWVHPQGLPNAQLIASSPQCQKKLGLHSLSLEGLWPSLLGLAPTHPNGYFASCYGGHQFGNWAGQLGDGRAVTLGFQSHANQIFEWQIKGLGPTPYSRGADGFAVLRSSLREYVCSHAMLGLGVPTSDALALLSSGETVERDILYSGNPKLEPGALCVRIAPSFVRFGHFEILAARREPEIMQNLLRWLCSHHFKQLDPQSTHFILDFFSEVTQKTCSLILDWMQVGFVHGVMNTDNMSIHGITLDYGPFGWLSEFNPQFTPNTTDFRQHRYAYIQQPEIGIWNLSRLAESLLLLHPHPNDFRAILERAHQQIQESLIERFCYKLNLDAANSSHLSLTEELLKLLPNSRLDFTLFFRFLEHDLDHPKTLYGAFHNISYSDKPPSEELVNWIQTYSKIKKAKVSTFRNPLFIPRNHLLFTAIQEVENQLPAIQHQKILFNEIPLNVTYPHLSKILQAASQPFITHPDELAFFKGQNTANFELYEKTPDWAFSKIGCNQLSCSS